VASAAPGCQQKPAPSAPRAADSGTTPRVHDGARLVFSFFDHRAELRAVEQARDVPAGVRAEVMVTDPARPALAGDQIIVADLRTRGKGGLYRAWIEPKGAWLDRVMPKLSQLRPLASVEPKPAPKAKVKIKRKPKKKRVVVAAQPAPAEQAVPRVILFSTAWCPSCKTARQYLQSRRVQFLELDVEKDARAAQKYQEITTAYRLRPGVVPLLIINGRPLQGFSKPQVDAALAAPPPA
jgi:glutaredoxin